MGTRTLFFCLCAIVLAASSSAAPIAIAVAAPAASSEASKQELRDRVERLRQERRYDEARSLAERALRAADNAKPTDTFDTLWWLMELGLILQEQGLFSEAEPHLTRALAMAERSFGPENVATVRCLRNLALNERGQGRFAEAEVRLKRAIAISERTRDEQALALSLNNLGELNVAQGRYVEAESLYMRALAIETARPMSERRIATIFNNLGNVAWKRGRYAEAEVRFKRAIDMLERVAGPDHPSTAQALGNLAVLYQAQGRFEEAEPLLLRSCDTLEKRLGASHPVVAACVTTLATLLHQTRRYTRAEQLYRRTLGLYEQALGPNAPEVGRALTNLGVLLSNSERAGEAEPVLRRARNILERKLTLAHPDTVIAANALAMAEAEQGNFAEAEGELRRVSGAMRQALPTRHPDLGDVLVNLSYVLFKRNKPDEAYLAAREGAEIETITQTLSAAAELKGLSPSLRRHDGVYVQQVRAAYALARAQPGREQVIRDAAFGAAQFVAFDETGRAVGQMAAKFAARGDPLGRLLHEQQDLLRRLRAINQLLAEAIGSPEPKMRAQAGEFRRQAEAVSARLVAIDLQLRGDNPTYADLADPRPISLAETQRLLGENEALVLVLSVVDETYLFAVTRSQVLWLRSDVAREELERQVATLRTQLDSSQWTGPIEAFDRTLAHRLYLQLLAPLEGVIKGKSELFVIVTGPLTSLPFSLMVTEPPRGGADGDRDPEALRQTAWLIKRYALTTLPSVSSLRALRAHADNRTASEAFAGFGDPLFDRGSEQGGRLRDLPRYFRGPETNLEMLRTLPRLRSTGEEVRAMAKLLGAPDSDIYLRERATEAHIKTRDLSRKRIIEIATHGLIAGDLNYAEPGLALSPPSAATALDDGYLSSSEAAGLNLHADLVILSACDTAAGEVPGANGLSGLARAFILAGSKSLLASHWAIEDRAAMLLTTRTVAGIQKSPALGRSEALRQAMLSVMNDRSDPFFAHPTAWAPFVLVGEPRTN